MLRILRYEGKGVVFILDIPAIPLIPLSVYLRLVKVWKFTSMAAGSTAVIQRPVSGISLYFFSLSAIYLFRPLNDTLKSLWLIESRSVELSLRICLSAY